MRKIFVLILGCALVLMFHETSLQAQDMAYYKQIIKELTAAKYQGRGYAKGGSNKAGKFLEKEFAKAGADEVVCQPFKLDINTYVGKMELSVDGRKQTPGVDFVMREYSPGVHGTYNLYFVDTTNFDAEKMYSDLAKPENKDCFVVCDFWFSYTHGKDFKNLQIPGACTN